MENSKEMESSYICKDDMEHRNSLVLVLSSFSSETEYIYIIFISKMLYFCPDHFTESIHKE